MSTLMSTVTPPPSLPATPSRAIELPSCPAIAFQIAEQWLAIPYAALLRVVHRSAVNWNRQSESIAYLGKQPLAILNLHSVLTNVHQNAQHQQDSIESPANSPFLVIAALETTLVGIPVNQLPILLELPLSSSQALPLTYYNAIQGIASHVISVPPIGPVLLLNLRAGMSQSF